MQLFHIYVGLFYPSNFNYCSQNNYELSFGFLVQFIPALHAVAVAPTSMHT
jgi:hypothetical protein